MKTFSIKYRTTNVTFRQFKSEIVYKGKTK